MGVCSSSRERPCIDRLASWGKTKQQIPKQTLYYTIISKSKEIIIFFKKSNMVLGDGWLGKNGALQAWDPEFGPQ